MDYLFSVRGRDGNGYSNKIGSVKYLQVPETKKEMERDCEISKGEWFKAVQADCGVKDIENGNVLVFIHGFNTEQYSMLERHRKIRKGLEEQGFDGTVVSYDWPSDGSALGYTSDRRDARRAADRLFVHGIKKLSADQRPDCKVNVHVLAHSMGNFLLREAFDYADDDRETAQKSWLVSQVAMVAADVSQKSMEDGNPKSSSLFRHAARVTCYYSPLDDILNISEVKRVGVARRLGRVGLPETAREKAVNLYCGAFYKKHKEDFGKDPGMSHKWYFDSPRFYEDLFATLQGKLDRNEIDTRAPTSRGNLALI